MWSTGPMFVNTVLKDYWFNDDQLTGKSEEEMSIKIINNHTYTKKDRVD